MFFKLGFSCFILGTQAPCAEFKVLTFTVDEDSSGVNVSRPIPVGVAFGMADVMSVKRDFAANIALQFTLSPLIPRINLAKYANT
jgi:hypothetical protein